MFLKMRLTSDYRRVTGLFNTLPEEEISYGEYGDNTLRTEFQAGPFTYGISFSPDEDRRSTVYVEFELIDINASDEELIRMMSKLKKSFLKQEDVQEQEQLMSLQEAKNLERLAINAYGHDELEIAGPYAFKVFGTVISIIKDYMQKHRVNCIIFSSISGDRIRIYQRMVKSAFPNAHVKTGPSPWGAGIEVRVCFV